MKLVYDENPPRSSNFGFLKNLNATKQALTHFENSLYLTFMMQNGNFSERNQASRELSIAEKKVEYWKKQPNFDSEEFSRGCEKLKKSWRR